MLYLLHVCVCFCVCRVLEKKACTCSDASTKWVHSFNTPSLTHTPTMTNKLPHTHGLSSTSHILAAQVCFQPTHGAKRHSEHLLKAASGSETSRNRGLIPLAEGLTWELGFSKQSTDQFHRQELLYYCWLVHRRHADDKHRRFPERELKLQATFLSLLFFTLTLLWTGLSKQATWLQWSSPLFLFLSESLHTPCHVVELERFPYLFVAARGALEVLSCVLTSSEASPYGTCPRKSIKGRKGGGAIIEIKDMIGSIFKRAVPAN